MNVFEFRITAVYRVILAQSTDCYFVDYVLFWGSEIVTDDLDIESLTSLDEGSELTFIVIDASTLPLIIFLLKIATASPTLVSKQLLFEPAH